MGLEEHLLHMFREDFEFHDDAGASHHGSHVPAAQHKREEAPTELLVKDGVTWLADAEKELRKIPFFVRGKARRNTEKFAADQGLDAISIETLYEAKAHYAR
jgi:light-independent protochlorophyllide reductase subunit B